MIKILETKTLFLVFVLLGSLALAGKLYQQRSSFSVAEIQTTVESSTPIDSRREAIEVAKDYGLLNKLPYKEFKNHNYNKWVILSQKHSGFWLVTLKTDDLIPSYTCSMKIIDQGIILHEGCGYNK